MNTLKTHVFSLVVVSLFALFGMRALFHPGLYTAHDIWHQVARLYWYSQSVRGGMFPPLWIAPMAGGFGYPLFLFSYSFPWIVAQPLLWGGVTVFDSIKVLFVLSFLFSGLAMYWFVFEMFRRKTAALVSSVLYMWAPYHFLQILVSAAMGRAFVFIFTPLLFLGVYFLGKEETRRRGIIIFCMAFVAATMSHLMSMLALVPALLLFTLWVKPKRSDLLTVGLVSVLLAAFYAVPAAFYSGLTQVRTGAFSSLYKSSFIDFRQLLYSRWGFGEVSGSAKDGAISFQLGFAQWVAVLLLVAWRKKRSQYFVLSLTLVASFCVSAFMLLSSSRHIWDLISKFVVIDYPTMFMTPLVFISSVAGGMVVCFLRGRFLATFLALALLFLVIVNNRNYLRVNMYTDFPLQTYVDSESTTSTYGEYFPSYFDQALTNTPKDVIVFEKDTTTREVEYLVNSLSFKVDNEKGQALTFRHLAFPGVVLYINNQSVSYVRSKEGLVSTYLDRGSYKVKIEYERTLLAKVSLFLSLIGALYLIFLVFRKV